MQNILSSITSIGQHQSQLIRLLTNKWNNKILFSSVVFSVSDRLEPGRASPSARWPGCRSSQTPEPTAWPRDVHSTGRWQNSKTRPLNTSRGKKTTIYLIFFEIKVIMDGIMGSISWARFQIVDSIANFFIMLSDVKIYYLRYPELRFKWKIRISIFN